MRVEAIDALRGLAALAVVFYHARGLLWAGTSQLYQRYGMGFNANALLGYVTLPLSFGWLGVTLFFVLSGYCIHRRGAESLADNPRATLNFPGFARRRFWRIYPTYSAALLLTGVVDWYVFRSTGYRDLSMDDHRWTTLASSLLGLQGFTAPIYGSNGVFWTLAMEIQLYLAYPLLFWVSRRHGPLNVLGITLLISGTFALLDNCYHIQHAFPYHFLRGPVFLPYWFSWAVGFYLAEAKAGRACVPRRSHLLLMAALAAIAALALVALNRPEASEPFWALLFGVAVWLSLGEAGRRVWNAFPGRAFACIGVFSYSLYATHYPVLLMFRALAIPPASKPESLLPALVGVVFALGVAYVFFLAVEQWSLRPSKVPVPPPIRQL